MENNESIIDQELQTDPLDKTKQPLTLFGGIMLGIQFLIIQMLAMIPVMVIVMAIYGAENQEAISSISNAVGMPLAFAAGAWYLYRKRGLISTAFRWENSQIPITLVGLITIFSISYIIGELMTYMPYYDEIVQFYMDMIGNMNPAALFLGVVLIGPICEEIIFRGIILEGLLNKYDSTKAIVYSALIFGGIHLIPIQVINAFFIGLVLAWIYIKTRSLWAVIVIHVLHNGIAVLGGDTGTATTRDYFGNDLYYYGSFALAAVVAYAGYLVLKNLLGKYDTMTESVA